ncbi:hypothetical protein [Rhizobium leguminosarum]|uniref:hypothetical protein n=1 Tax=Rhizobium leguminosarum TaxID=384 RepID=UPI002E10F911|nr:hypothetical protein U8Q02_42660 [Rhizobium leguminosarum]
MIELGFPEIRDLVEIGLFRRPGGAFPNLDESLLRHASELIGAEVVSAGDGWHVVLSDDTACGDALLRIAGAVEDAKIPLADVVEGMLKNVAYGPRSERTEKLRKARGKVWAEYFDSLPARAAVVLLCEHVGATVSGDDVDFSTCPFVVETSTFEKDVLYCLEETPERSMPTSRLCRKLDGYPSRTLVDMKLAAIPFVLKDKGGAPRIIGASGMQHVLEPVESFVTLHRSSDGVRVMIEYRLSEETVECNSFNIPADCRSAVHGDFVEITTGVAIRHDMHSRDARKVTGIGPAVRRMFPGYTGKEGGFVLLDAQTGEARVEVVGMHSHDAREAMMLMLETGILPGCIDDVVAQLNSNEVTP